MGQGVFIPGMRPELTTEKVLVMEWVAGSRLRSAGKRRQGAPALAKMLSLEPTYVFPPPPPQAELDCILCKG